MVKSIISAVVGFIILITASLIEQNVVTKTFNEFNNKLTTLQMKTENEIATETDALIVQEFWIEKKKTLHVIIPHNEIKEIDLWISEAVCLIKTENYLDALAKLEVAIELVEQIPKTFSVTLANVL